MQFSFKSEICGDVGVILKLQLTRSHSVPLFFGYQSVSAGHRTSIVMTESNAEESKPVVSALKTYKHLHRDLVARARPAFNHTFVNVIRKFVVS